MHHDQDISRHLVHMTLGSVGGCNAPGHCYIIDADVNLVIEYIRIIIM